MIYLYCAAGLLGIAAAVYGLHQLGLFLERQGYIYYWYTKPTGGGGSSVFAPLQEFTQPQIKHVIEAQDEKWVEEEGASGDDAHPGQNSR